MVTMLNTRGTLAHTLSEIRRLDFLYHPRGECPLPAFNPAQFVRNHCSFSSQGGPAGRSGLSAPAKNAVADYRGRPREYGVTFQYNFY
jgi:hypothetical protein